jgi:hypothetical protein
MFFQEDQHVTCVKGERKIWWCMSRCYSLCGRFHAWQVKERSVDNNSLRCQREHVNECPQTICIDEIGSAFAARVKSQHEWIHEFSVCWKGINKSRRMSSQVETVNVQNSLQGNTQIESSAKINGFVRYLTRYSMSFSPLSNYKQICQNACKFEQGVFWDAFDNDTPLSDLQMQARNWISVVLETLKITSRDTNNVVEHPRERYQCTRNSTKNFSGIIFEEKTIENEFTDRLSLSIANIA